MVLMGRILTQGRPVRLLPCLVNLAYALLGCSLRLDAEETKDSVVQHLQPVGNAIVVDTLADLGMPRQAVNVDQQFRLAI
jgi:hypothetical protein